MRPAVAAGRTGGSLADGVERCAAGPERRRVDGAVDEHVVGVDPGVVDPGTAVDLVGGAAVAAGEDLVVAVLTAQVVGLILVRAAPMLSLPAPP